MFAVIQTGGKQYKVAQDQIVTVEKIDGDEGGPVEFDQVLAVSQDDNHMIGSPLLDGAGVRGTIVEQTHGDKVIVFKKKRRHNYRRKRGHVQDLTVVRITEIVSNGFKKQVSKSAPAKKTKPKDDTSAATESKGVTANKQTAAKKKAAVKKTAAKKAATSRPAGPKATGKKSAAKKKPAPKAKKT